MQSALISVTVPGGRWVDGALTREVHLRPLVAAEAIEVLDKSEAARSPARLVTALLARCAEMSDEAVAELTVGDREALLLHLRRLTFGERMPCVLTCPRAECGERMDLDLLVSDLLLSPYPDPRVVHEAVFEDAGASWTVQFRLPNGSDQEAVADAPFDEDRAVELLLRRCVRRAERDGGAADRVPPGVARQLSELMGMLDPQAEIILEPRCPACQGVFHASFDTTSWLFRELTIRTRALLSEVHVLASVYHWSEAAILALPEHRRRWYLDLVEASTSRRLGA
jgi:hypothetical protein